MNAGPVRWSLCAAVLLLAVGLTGCLSGQEPTSTETMVTATVVDPWEDGETERVLFEGTVVAGECYPGAGASETVFSGSLMGGCAYVPQRELAPIPLGTGVLLIEVDARDALHSGEYYAFVYTTLRTEPEDAAGEPSSEPVAAWSFPLDPREWDVATPGYSHVFVGLWSASDGAPPSVLQGPVDVRVIAERDPAWEPPRFEYRADPPAVVPDPFSQGPHTFGMAEYDFGWTVVTGRDTTTTFGAVPAGPLPVRGIMAYPTDGEGPFPVAVFIHGAHATCHVDGWGILFGAHACPEAPPASMPLRHYRGFDYMLENLASHGWVVFSIDASWIDDRGRPYTMADVFAGTSGNRVWDQNARADLVLATLDEITTLHSEARDPVGDALVGMLELDRIGLVGYSRGGGGVLQALQINEQRPPAERHGVRGVFTVVPGHGVHAFEAPSHVALGTLVAYCDASGTGYVRQGTQIFDENRHSTARTAPIVQVIAMAANHERYNAASTGPDSRTFMREYCATHMAAGGGLLPGEDQRAHAVVVVNGFLRAFVADEREMRPLFTGDSSIPSSACPTQVRACSTLLHRSFHPSSDQRLDLERVPGEEALTTNTLGGSVILEGFEHKEVCQAGSCPSGITRGTANHIHLVWDAPARYELELPSSYADLSDYTTFSFRAGVDPTDPHNPGPGEDQDLRVVIEDTDGQTASVVVSDHSAALFHPPGEAEECFTSTATDPCWIEAQMIANQVRIPLEAFADQDIDLTSIASVSLVFDATPSGAMQVTDLMFWRANT